MLDYKEYLNVYEFKTELPGSNQSIKFRPITTMQMKRLLSYSVDNDNDAEQALDDLMSNSVITEGFDIKNLYLQDRFFLLVELRKASKGSKYTIETPCKECHSQFISVIDLDKLKTTKLTMKPDDYIVKLDKNISVKMTPLTRGMQLSTLDYIKSNDIVGKEAEVQSIIVNNAQCVLTIITPKGETTEISLEDKVEFIMDINTDMYGKIRDWIDGLDFGVDFTLEIKCIHCNAIEKVRIPLENFLF